MGGSVPRCCLPSFFDPQQFEAVASHHAKCIPSPLATELPASALMPQHSWKVNPSEATLVPLGASALLTPTGRTPSGKEVYTVPPGSRVAAYSASHIEVLAPNGTLLHTFSNGNSPSPSEGQDYNVHFAQAFYDCGTDASTGDPTQITTLNATFVVPPIPENYESQVLFIGPGLEGFDPVTNESVGIFQTALQYGASPYQGGPFWTVYAILETPSFYVIPSPAASSSSESPPIPRQETQPVVYPGDTITTAILYDPDGPQFDDQHRVWYEGTFVGPASLGDGPLLLEISFSNPPSRVRAKILLQEEGSFEAADYPAGEMVFEDIQLVLNPNTTTPGTEPEIWWSVLVDPATSVGVEVLVDGGVDAKVAIVFPDSA
uniref:Galactose oxidase-like Early set domain-containing protein n=1 Tax=Mycena chlorophos TaxID=658473 RepID=A0ABQ0LN61_MYCCL|nr:predicted protein [Mycena chlorophos]